MFKIIGFLLALLFTALNSSSQQINSKPTAADILRFNKIGKEYKCVNRDHTITTLKYLGMLHTDKGTKFKLLTSVWIWGKSHRATNRILVYSYANKYIGNYALTISSDLPTYIKNNQLVFINTNKECDSTLITCVDFAKGLPTEFFRKCEGGSGDSYTFERN